MNHAPAILEARGITKHFGGVVALRGVNFDLKEGEVHAICGENGAGKSTLIKILSGLHPHGSFCGELLIDGRLMAFRKTRDAQRSGVAVIYQELALVEEMSVAENIFLGEEPCRGWRLDWDRMYREARELLEQFGVRISPDTAVRELGVGQKQLIEIVKALRKSSRILILDEPTAALAETEVATLMQVLRTLTSRGVSCVYISHKLEEVREIAHRITVLRDGESVASLEASEATIQEIIRAMVGREIGDYYPRSTRSCSDRPILEVRHLSVAADPQESPAIDDVSLTVCAGEVLGIGGLMGAGRSELLLHLFGAWGVRLHGDVQINGRPLIESSPRESIRRGLVMVTEDRKRYGLISDQSVGFNLSLSSLRAVTRHGLVREYQESQVNTFWSEMLGIRTPGLEFPVRSLSGGNQQKVVLGKALMTEPKVILLDEPTRGIDIGAKQDIYEQIRKLATAGKAVVLVSSELPELIGLSDRILMLHEGRVSGEFVRGEFSQTQLLAAALGHP